jgi:hypothetical protein
LKAALNCFEAAHRAERESADRNAAAAASREIRYWGARRASAEVVKTSDDKRKASFGMTVTLRRDDGREQSFRIVGEDEADPSRGTAIPSVTFGPRAADAWPWRGGRNRWGRSHHPGRAVRERAASPKISCALAWWQRGDGHRALSPI